MRRAIEAIPVSELPVYMARFPAGACGDASYLLGAYLADCGEAGFQYVCGERAAINANMWTSHAWLSRSGLVVDITADQFLDAPSAVIVERNSVWHGTFQVEDPPELGDFRAWLSGPGSDHLYELYPKLAAKLL